MPHEPRPFYKNKRRTWYFEINRVQRKLGKHPDHLLDPKKSKDGHWQAPPEILTVFRRVMAETQDASLP